MNLRRAHQVTTDRVYVKLPFQRRLELSTLRHRRRDGRGLTRRRLRGRAALRRKPTDLGQAADAAEQELELAVGRARHVLGDLVAGEFDGDPGEAALGVGAAEDAAAADEADGGGGDGLVLGLLDDEADGGIVGDVEEARVGVAGEPLLAVPGHVVQGCEGAVGREEEVEAAAADDHVVGAVDHRAEGEEAGGRGAVT